MAKRSIVGVISDTHGLLRPEALSALHGSDILIHAGDVGDADILPRLRTIAPVFAVRGNVDAGPWAEALPETEVVEAGEVSIYVLHDVAQLDLVPAAAGFAAVIYGHSHQPSIRYEFGVLFLNPGSAGPRRFRLPIAVARTVVAGRELRPEIVEIVA